MTIEHGDKNFDNNRVLVTIVAMERQQCVQFVLLIYMSVSAIEKLSVCLCRRKRKMYSGLREECPIFLDFNQIWIFSRRFLYKTPVSNLT
jgi:hypothetical protein